MARASTTPRWLPAACCKALLLSLQEQSRDLAGTDWQVSSVVNTTSAQTASRPQRFFTSMSGSCCIGILRSDRVRLGTTYSVDPKRMLPRKRSATTHSLELRQMLSAHPQYRRTHRHRRRSERHWDIGQESPSYQPLHVWYRLPSEVDPRGPLVFRPPISDQETLRGLSFLQYLMILLVNSIDRCCFRIGTPRSREGDCTTF